MLLHCIFKHFRLQKDRGGTLTQQHLLGVRLQGNGTKELEDFRTRYVLGALEEDEVPSRKCPSVIPA